MGTEEDFLKDVAQLLQCGDLPDLRSPIYLETNDLFGDPGTDSDCNTFTTNRQQRRRHCTQRDKDKKRQRKYRQRLRDDREELLRQIDTLSTQLLRLKKAVATTKIKLLPTSRWGPEAVSQREKRCRAEAEQKRLAAAITSQARYIENLRGIAERDHDPQSNGIPRFLPIATLLYSAYTQELEGCYARIDNVFSSCGLVSLTSTAMDSVHRRQSDGGVAYFQHLNKMTLSYNFQHTSHALEKLLFLVSPESDDIQAETTSVQTRVVRPLDAGALCQRFLPRVYNEVNRTVFVWKVWSEGEGVFDGLHSSETAWLCVQPCSTGVLLEICVQQVPTRFRSSQVDESDVAHFYGALHSSLSGDKQHMMTALENLLPDIQS